MKYIVSIELYPAEMKITAKNKTEAKKKALKRIGSLKLDYIRKYIAVDKDYRY